MSKPPNPPQVLLRRQGRPAPSHGPGYAPRPPVTPPAPPPKPVESQGAAHRNGPVPHCDRCHRQRGEFRWAAATKCAGKFLPELGLCADCLGGLRSFLVGYENKIRQKTQAALLKAGSSSHEQ
jgi:hypothetical protein